MNAQRSADLAITACLEAVIGPQQALVIIVGLLVGLGAGLRKGFVGAFEKGVEEAPPEAGLAWRGRALSLPVGHVHSSESMRGRWPVRDRAVRPDTAARNLVRQLNALPAAQYEFAVFDSHMVRRVWRIRQAMQALGWLNYRNARGAHIYFRLYFRPATSDCVLVDDLSAKALAYVLADGLVPAVVVENSPANFQAWFRVGREFGPKLGTCTGQVLAARYGGGPASVDFRHLGRQVSLPIPSGMQVVVSANEIQIDQYDR